MVPFNLETALNCRPVTFITEQLHRLADADGLIFFDVQEGNERRSVIYENVEVGIIPAEVTIADAEAYFEELHYPQQVEIFSKDDIFALDEVRAIGRAIRAYNQDLRLRFNQFMSRA